MGKVISGVGKLIGKVLGVNTDPPPLPPVPEPPPIIPREAVKGSDSVSDSTKQKIKGRRNRSGTIKTKVGSGVTTGTQVRYESLLGSGQRD
jgi:hypothetical protein